LIGYPQFVLPLVLSADAAILVSFRARIRELLLHVIVVAGVLNFTAALFSPENLDAQPVLIRGIKDIPLALLFLTALMVQRTAPDTQGRFKAALAVWGLIFGVLVALTPTPFLGVLVEARYLLLYPLAALAVHRLDLSPAERQRIFRAVVVAALLESALAVAEYVGLVGNTYYGPRAIGTMGNPNNLALFLGMAVLVMLAGLDGHKHRLGLVLVLAGLAATGSRGAPIALALALLLPRAGRSLHRSMVVFILLAGLGLIVIVSRQGLYPGSRTQQPLAAEEWLASPRTFLIGEGVGLRNPLTGTFETSDTSIAPTATADSMLLFLAKTGGVLALSAFGWLLWRTGEMAKGTPVWPILLFFLAYMPAYGNFTLFPAALLFWIFFGMSESRPAEAATEDRVPARAEGLFT
jgi:hypothetical protein